MDKKEEDYPLIVKVLIADMEALRHEETRWELNDENIDNHIHFIKELANG